MTAPDVRRRRARNLARYVSTRVRELVPPEVMDWPDSYVFVKAPSAAFLDALALWETGGSHPTHEHQLRARVVKASNAVFAAWRDAGVAYEAARDRGGRSC